MNGYNLDLQGSPGLYRNGTQKSFVLMGKGKASMWVQVKEVGAGEALWRRVATGLQDLECISVCLCRA